MSSPWRKKILTRNSKRTKSKPIQTMSIGAILNYIRFLEYRLLKKKRIRRVEIVQLRKRRVSLAEANDFVKLN